MKLQPTAKVVFVTNKGKIEIDLYPNHIPNLCKAFISNCVNKRFNGCTFGGITSDLVQTQRSLTLQPFAKEFHSRLKFDGKGDVGLLNLEEPNKATPDGFFITRKPCPTYNAQYVIIGKISDETIYNVMKIADCEKKEDGETPLFPISVLDTLVPLPYFKDLEESTITKDPTGPTTKKPKKTVKLSYDDEENDEDIPFVMKWAHENISQRQTKKQNGQGLNEIQSEEKKEEKKEEIKDKDMDAEEQLKPETTTPMQLENTQVNEIGNKTGSEGPVSIKPDPSIDPFDPNIDIETDSVPFEKLQKHYFKCR